MEAEEAVKSFSYPELYSFSSRGERETMTQIKVSSSFLPAAGRRQAQGDIHLQKEH